LERVLALKLGDETNEKIFHKNFETLFDLKGESK